MANNTTNAIISGPAYRVEFNYQSQHLMRTEWVALFTLCLAPLVAHLLAGAPRVVYLHQSMPKWHDTLVLYNPISIIWRYFAITERSVCSPRMSLEEIAAVNVVYWTSNGWHGSEAAIQQGKALCVQRAPRARDILISSGTMKTLIVATQGVAAAGALLPGPLSEPVNNLGTVFLPIAFIGLLRLPAAYWLTDDFVVMHLLDTNEDDDSSESHTSFTPQGLLLPRKSLLVFSQSWIRSDEGTSVPRYRPRFVALAVRILYLAFLLFGLGVCIYRIIIPIRYSMTISLTVCVMAWSYAFWLVSGMFILVQQVFKRRSQPVSIPCANSRWYKAYTWVLLLLSLLATAIAALETRRTWAGYYTADPLNAGIWTCEYTAPGRTESSNCWQRADGIWTLC